MAAAEHEEDQHGVHYWQVLNDEAGVNIIGNVGIMAIARAMETNTSLQRIEFGGLVVPDGATTTALGGAAIATIEAALARNRDPHLRDFRETYTAVRSFVPPFDGLIDRAGPR
jgi:hypothetical protein